MAANPSASKRRHIATTASMSEPATALREACGTCSNTSAMGCSTRCARVAAPPMLTPMPTTTWGGAAAPGSSIKMPQSLRSWASTSFGHLTVIPRTPAAVNVCATATPTARLTAPISSNGRRMRMPRLKAKLRAKGLAHWRPRRPRPAVCASANSTVPSISPPAARCMSSVLVEPMWGNTSSVLSHVLAATPSCARMAFASSSSRRSSKIAWSPRTVTP